MIIYRVEHGDSGVGPYHLSIDVNKWWDSWSRHSGLPEPRMETKIAAHPRFVATQRYGCMQGSQWFCGFDSRESLERWFTQAERHRLSQLGFVIALYEADENDVIVGDHQAVFVRARAKKLTYDALVPVGPLQEEFSHDKRASAGYLASVALSGVAVLHGSRYAPGGAPMVTNQELDLPSYLAGSSITNQIYIRRKEP